VRGLSIGFGRQWLSLMLAAILASLALNCLVGSSGLQDLLALRYHSDTLVEERDRLAKDNAAFSQRIARLMSDDVYLQQLVRQELGYVRTGELVYRFSKSDELRSP